MRPCGTCTPRPASAPVPPRREVLGFRAPFLKLNPVLGTVLQDLGFLYDSSLFISHQQDATQPAHVMAAVQPFPYSCSASDCSNWSALSIW